MMWLAVQDAIRMSYGCERHRSRTVRSRSHSVGPLPHESRCLPICRRQVLLLRAVSTIDSRRTGARGQAALGHKPTQLLEADRVVDASQSLDRGIRRRSASPCASVVPGHEAVRVIRVDAPWRDPVLSVRSGSCTAPCLIVIDWQDGTACRVDAQAQVAEAGVQRRPAGRPTANHRPLP